MPTGLNALPLLLLFFQLMPKWENATYDGSLRGIDIDSVTKIATFATTQLGLEPVWYAKRSCEISGDSVRLSGFIRCDTMAYEFSEFGEFYFILLERNVTDNRLRIVDTLAQQQKDPLFTITFKRADAYFIAIYNRNFSTVAIEASKFSKYKY